MEHPRHLSDPDAPLLEQHQQMIQEVCRLLGEPLVPERRDYHLDSLLPYLLRHPRRPAPDEPCCVRPLGHLPVPLGYRSGELLQNRPEARRAAVLNPGASQGSKKAAIFPGMAGRAARQDPVEEGVRVAVQPYLDSSLGVAARRSFAPEFLPRAGVVVGLPGFERLLQGLAVGVGEREDGSSICILGYNGAEAPFVEPDLPCGAHRTGIPACLMCSLTCAMLHSPKWKMLAARTAPAPAFTAAIKCSGPPAPPEATMGRLVFSATAEMRSRS